MTGSMISYPPRMFKKILRYLSNSREQASLVGDTEEEYNEIASVRGSRRADNWYRMQVLKSTPVFFQSTIYWSIVMFKNYLKIALRNIKRHKAYSFINISGLAIGMAACLLIYLYVQKELSYDRFHSDADRIYRVLTIDKALGVTNNLVGITIPALSPALERELPEVQEFVRVAYQGRSQLKIEDRRVVSSNFAYVDENMLSFFDFGLKALDIIADSTNTKFSKVSQIFSYLGITQIGSLSKLSG